MTKVARIVNPEAFSTEAVQTLFKRAFKGSLLPGLDEAPAEYVQLMMSPLNAFFVGAEEGEMQALAIVMLPPCKLALGPQVFHFASFGSAKLKDAVIQAVVDFVLKSGYTSFWALNLSKKQNAVWARAFKKAGQINMVGSIAEFKIG